MPVTVAGCGRDRFRVVGNESSAHQTEGSPGSWRDHQCGRLTPEDRGGPLAKRGVLPAQTVGLVKTNIRLSNPREAQLQPLDVEALVDTDAITLCIPEHIALQLRLQPIEEREVTTADGRKTLCPYVGPAQVTFGKRNCFTGALVLGDVVLLGAIPMEDMDLVVHPASQALSVNPESPNIPSVLVK